MKNNFKFLIVLTILLAGCICVGSTFAADSSIDVTDVSSVDDTQNIEIAHDDSSQKDVEINNLQVDEGNFATLRGQIDNKALYHNNTLTLDRDYKKSPQDSPGPIDITNHSVVIDGAGHIIDAHNYSGVFHISGNGVTIKNINFINCNGRAIYWEGRSANLINCTFTNSYSDNNGGAVYLAESYGNVNGCNFTNCSTNGGNSYGGAIYLGGNSLTSLTSITNCNFINSFSLDGGGAIGGDERVIISGCNFTNCIATWSGGAIYLSYTMINFSDCNFVNCSSMVGGAIYLTYTTGEIIGCNFTNSSSPFVGGAIYWNTTYAWIIPDGKVIGCNFINSSSGSYGGAIYLTGAEASVSDCNFTNSNSTYGGVIYCNSTGSVSGCTFTNTLAEDGGAICWKGSDGIIVGCNFTNSNASSGGAIYLYGTAITLSCDFINTTAKYGGAIYSYNTDCSISTCNFINTSADDGGAIYCYNTEGSVSACNFINTSADDGGAIYCYNAESIVIGCDFINTSADDGGAIYWNGANGNVSDCTFTNSNASTGGAIYWNGIDGSVSDCTFTNSNASTGGAIYWNGIDGSVSGCNFTDSEAILDGGAIYWKEDKGTLNDCTFTNSKSFSSGGAIYWYHNNGNMSDCTFNNCFADVYGGAIFCGGADCDVSDCVFNNTTASYGGAIYLLSDNDGNISACNFTNTIASASGGAIYWKGINGSVSACTFINTTSLNCGAIYWNGANGKLSDSNFFNSTSKDYAGAIYWNGVNGSVSACNFTNTHTINNGGAIYWDNSKFCNVTDSIFTNCSATLGPAMYIHYASDLSINNCSNTPKDNDFKAPIYNDGTIVSDVVITTIDGKVKKVTEGEVVNLKGIITASDIRVAGGVLTLTVDGNELNTTSDETGLYSKEYAVGFTGTKPVNAIYKNSTEELQSLIPGKLTTGRLDVTVAADNVTGVFTETKNVTVTVVDVNGDPITGGVVTILWNGENQTQEVSNGTVTFDLLLANVGNFTVTAYYNGSTTTDYQDGEGNFTVIANKLTPHISISNEVIGEFSTVDVNVTYLGNPVPGTVELYVDDVLTNSSSLVDGKTSFTFANPLTVGNHIVTVKYLESENFTEVSDNYTIKIASVEVNASDIVYGDNLTVNITVNDVDGVVPTGNVTILVNGVEEITVNLTDGKCSYILDLAAGTYEITAIYNGDNNYIASNSSCNVTVSKATPHISVSVDNEVIGEFSTVYVNVTYLGNSVPGTVELYVDGNLTDNSSLVDGKTSFTFANPLTVGEHVVTVKYPENENFTEASANYTIKTASLDIIAEDIVYGENLTVNVTVNGVDGVVPTGNVTIFVNGTEYANIALVDGKCSYIPDLAAGTYEIVACYSGDNNYGICNDTCNVTVSKATPHISVSVDNEVIGEFSTVDVNVTNFGNSVPGTVELYVDGNLTDNCSLVDGEYSFTFANPLTVGEHIVTVKYLENENFTEASANYSGPKWAFVDIIAEDIVYGDNLTVNVTINGVDGVVPTGKVTISVNDVEEGTVDLIDGKCSYIINDLATDTYKITAKYSGDNNYFSMFPGSCYVTVSKANTTIGIIADDVIYGNNGTIIVTVPSDATGNVFVYINGTYYDAIRKNKTVFVVTTGVLDMGEYPIEAALLLDNNYNNAFNGSSLLVKFMSVDVADMVYGGNTTVDVSLYAGANGTITVYIDGTPIGSENITGSSYTLPISGINAGDHNVTVTFDDNTYGHQTANTTFNVAKFTPDMYVDIGSETSFDIIYGDTVVVIATIPDNVTGTVSFSLDNDTWIPVEIVNGSAEYDIPGLDAGNYIFFVRYDGDINYNQVYTENPFTIDQLKTTVTVDPVKGKAGERVKITARVTDQNGNPVEDGYVIIGFNGKEYKAYVVNGIATVEVTLPNKAGTYSATAYYEGFNYNSSYAVFTVEVSDIPGPNPNPNPINNGVDMENTGNPLLVLLIALCAIGLESFRRKF